MFNFPHADPNIKREFRKNFLKSVLFQIHFDPITDVNSKKERIVDIFKELLPRVNDNVQFGVNFIYQHGKATATPSPQQINGFELRSLNGQIILSVLRENITLNISGTEYKNFDYLKKYTQNIVNVIELFGISQVKKLAIRKINMVDFVIPDQIGIMPFQLSNMILNDQLLLRYENIPSGDFIQQSINNLSFASSDYQLNLIYGLNLNRINKREGQIILDIDLFKTTTTKNEEIGDISESINNEIFNIFIWGYKESTINSLKI